MFSEECFLLKSLTDRPTELQIMYYIHDSTQQNKDNEYNKSNNLNESVKVFNYHRLPYLVLAMSIGLGECGPLKLREEMKVFQEA